MKHPNQITAEATKGLTTSLQRFGNTLSIKHKTALLRPLRFLFTHGHRRATRSLGLRTADRHRQDKGYHRVGNSSLES